MHATFPAHLRELPQILLWLKGYLVQRHCDASFIRKLELAVEEAVINIIHYAKTDSIEITLKGTVEITIVDHGLPFNPLEVIAHDQTLPLEKRKEGGLGIFLMKQVVDEVHYHREDNTNVLMLKKKI